MPINLTYLILSAVIFAYPAAAQDINDDEINDISNNLAQCAGFYSAMSEFMKDLDKKNTAESLEGQARGARLASAFSMHMSEQIPKWKNALLWSDNMKDIHRTHWLSLMELHTPTEEQMLPSGATENMALCASLNPIQTKLVKMIRETILYTD